MYLLTTEALGCYRRTDINVLKAIFPALLWRGLQYACQRQTLRQRARRAVALRVNHRSFFVRFTMRITSQLICQAADDLKGFVGLNRKTGQ